MKQKSGFLFISLIGILIISGCTTQTGAGNGVVIREFAPDISTQVFSGDPVKFRLKVENTGTETAKNVIADLSGIVKEDWGILTFITLGDLLPFDLTTNTPGAVKTVEWDAIAPSPPQGITRTYNPTVEVTYDYRTTANKPITVISADELRRRRDGQTTEGLPAPKQATYSAGPLTVEVRTGNYVRSGPTGLEHDVFPIYIRVINAATGVVVPGIFGQTDYPILVFIDLPNNLQFTFTGFGQECTEARTLFNMWKGETLEITCELEVVNPPDTSFETDIALTLDYTYRVTQKSTITVSGV